MWTHKPHTKIPDLQVVRFQGSSCGNINVLNQDPSNAHDNKYGVRNDDFS